MCISLEKQQFRLLVTLSLIFVADTKIIFGYNLVAPFRNFLDLQCSNYEKIFIWVDLNVEIEEANMKTFCENHSRKSLIK